MVFDVWDGVSLAELVGLAKLAELNRAERGVESGRWSVHMVVCPCNSCQPSLSCVVAICPSGRPSGWLAGGLFLKRQRWWVGMGLE